MTDDKCIGQGVGFYNGYINSPNGGWKARWDN